MLVECAILAFCSSIDALSIGVTYGIKNTKISKIGNIILFILAFSVSLISVSFGNSIREFFSDKFAKLIGSFILILLGLFILYQNIVKKEIKNPVVKDPSISDFDNSNRIDAKEALFLGLAVSLDIFCVGIGSSIIGINSVFFPLFSSTFHLSFLNIGNFIGKKIYKISKLPDNLLSIVSGILLMLIGIIKLFT